METSLETTGIDERAEIEGMTAQTWSFEQIAGLAKDLKNSQGARANRRRRELAAAFIAGAFAAPEQNADFYDAAALGWFGEAVKAKRLPSRDRGRLPLSTEFWTAFWDLISVSTALDPGTLTIRVATLGACVAPEFQQRAADASSAFPGVSAAAEMGIPARARLEDLKACPSGSLGEQLYRLIVDNGFDLEVLDRDALALESLVPPLNYLNTRILYAHDLWHIVAGYDLTALHEVGLSAFQLGQFGHGYSAMFLAVVVTSAALSEPAGFDLLMETILAGWRHGRQTPSLMLVPWDKVWHKPADAIRRDYGVEPFVSPFPPDIFEQLARRTQTAA